MTYRFFFTCLAVLIVGGCAVVKPVGPPPNGSLPVRTHISPGLPTLTEKFGSATDIPNTYFGISGARGSLLVGLLPGRIGVLANASYVQSQNEKLAPAFAVFTSLDLDLADALRDVNTSMELASNPKVGQYTLVPASRIFVLDDKRFLLTCMLNVDYQHDTDMPWRTYYEVNADTIFAIGNPANKRPMPTLGGSQ